LCWVGSNWNGITFSNEGLTESRLMEKEPLPDNFWRGFWFALPLSLLLWIAIGLIIYAI
jgi:hypothetical protein